MVARDLGVQGFAGCASKSDLKILQGRPRRTASSSPKAARVLPRRFPALPTTTTSPAGLHYSPLTIRVRPAHRDTSSARAPQDSARYFALSRWRRSTSKPRAVKDKTLFDTSPALSVSGAGGLEHEQRELTTRPIDLLGPIGKGQRG